MTAERRDRVLAVAAGLAALLVYTRTLAPTVLPGDSGEFQFAAPLLGLAHPTGYPLYLILGKLWTVLVPLGDAAWRMNMLSAVLAAMAVGALYLLARRLGVGAAPSLIGSLALAFSLTFWSQAVRAEVYALNSLFTVALLALAVACGVGRDRRALLALLVTAGLSLAHHRMTLLLAPALLLLAWPGLRDVRRAAPRRTLALGLVALLLPLLLYLYIPLRASATPYMRLNVGGGPELVLYDNTPGAFAAMVTGSVFRGSLNAGGGMAERAGMAAGLLRQQFGPVGLALAAAGWLWLLWRTRRSALALLLAYAAVVAFCLVYLIGDIADLFTPSYIIVALCIAAGVHALAETASRVVSSLAGPVVLAAAALLPLALLAGNWQAVDMSGRRETRTAWESLLAAPLPQGAVMVSNDRDEMTPMWYMQYVEQRRTDLTGLFPLITPGEDFASLGALLDWLLARGQQPLLIKPMPGLDIKYTVEPGGVLPQVTGYAAPRPLAPQTTLNASFGGQMQLVGADAPVVASPGTTLAVTLYWTPQTAMSEDYHVFLQLVDAGGQRVQGSDHRPGQAFYPMSAWRMGDVLADRHALALPAGLAAGDYALVAGVYRYPALTRLTVGDGQETTVRVATLRVAP